MLLARGKGYGFRVSSAAGIRLSWRWRITWNISAGRKDPGDHPVRGGLPGRRSILPIIPEIAPGSHPRIQGGAFRRGRACRPISHCIPGRQRPDLRSSLPTGRADPLLYPLHTFDMAMALSSQPFPREIGWPSSREEEGIA